MMINILKYGMAKSTASGAHLWETYEVTIMLYIVATPNSQDWITNTIMPYVDWLYYYFVLYYSFQFILKIVNIFATAFC